MCDIRRMKSVQNNSNQVWIRRTYLVLALGLTLSLIVSFGILGSMPQGGDGPSYSAQAVEFIDGTSEFLYFPPGTALVAVPFYWLFGQSTFVDHLIGFALTSGFLIASVWFSYVVFGWGRLTFVTALFFAFYPHLVLSSTQISSLPLTAILLTGVAGLAIRCYRNWSWWEWGCSCILLAFAIVTRPASIMIVIVLAVSAAYLLRQQMLTLSRVAGASALLLMTVFIVTFPFLLQNANHQQGWVISTNSEWNLFLSNTPYTPDYKTGHFGQRRFDQVSPEARAYLSNLLPDEDPSQATMAQRRAMRDSAFSYMWQNPARTLYRVSNRLRAYLSLDYTASRGIQNAYYISNLAFTVLLALEGGAFLLIFFFAVSAPFLSKNPMVGKGAFLIGICVAGMLPYLVAFAQARYHLPAVPLIMVSALVTYREIAKSPKIAWSVLYSNWKWWAVIFCVLLMQVENLYYLILHR